MFKKKLLKILLTAVCLAAAAGAVIGIRHLNASRSGEISLYSAEETFVPNEALTALDGRGLQLADENDQLQLWVDLDDGNIQVVNKENGYVWRSAPTDEEMALEKSNKLWTNNLRAPILFTYVQEVSAANTKYSNTLTEEAKVTVYRMDRGVRVYFELQVHKVTFAYEACLEGGGLSVSIPSALVSDPGEVYKTSSSGRVSLDKDASCVMAEFYLFPNLGATRSDMGVEGALFVPDGTGALIDFQSRKFVNSQYVASVYGTDMALANGFDSTLRSELEKSQVAFPVYGVIREGNTLMAVVDAGETQASVVASRAGVQTGFNTVSARFNYRMKYKVITNSSTGDGYLNYTSFAVKEPRRVKYLFGTGDWVGMAGQYRDYLQEKYALTPLSADAEPALQLNLVGGDIESGMLGDTFIPMTTFDQAGKILTWLWENGVGPMDVTYSGWAKRGESVEYPDRFPVAGPLGGGAGLKAFSEKARELGAKVYLRDNHLRLQRSQGLSVGRDTVHNIQGYPLFSGAFANSAFMASSYEKSKNQYQEYGISGIQEEGAGALLMTDYAIDAALSRQGVMSAQRDMLREMIQVFGAVRLSSGNAYTLMNGVTLTRLPSSSYLTMLDEQIPFYPLVLHGMVEYLAGDYMDFYEQRSQLLHAIALGGSVSFTFSWENTEKLAYSDTAAYYSTTFELWREDVLAVWQEILPYLRATKGQKIVGFETLKPGVTETVYENGFRVLVNNTDEVYSNASISLAARSFRLLEGR